MKQITVTLRPNGTTIIAAYPDGFPVDGDAILRRGATLAGRAKDVLANDPALLTAARAFLGAPLHRDEEPLRARQVATLTDRLYCGGAAAFVTNTLAAA